MTEELALFGGSPVLGAPFPPYPSIGAAEADAVRDVVASGCLSATTRNWATSSSADRPSSSARFERFGVAHRRQRPPRPGSSPPWARR